MLQDLIKLRKLTTGKKEGSRSGISIQLVHLVHLYGPTEKKYVKRLFINSGLRKYVELRFYTADSLQQDLIIMMSSVQSL